MLNLSSSPCIQGSHHLMLADCMSRVSLSMAMSIGAGRHVGGDFSHASTAESIPDVIAQRHRGANRATSPAAGLRTLTTTFVPVPYLRCSP